jgi:GNAT superfamily N-acetyltransferase
MPSCLFKTRKMEPKDFQKAADLANTMNWHMTPEDFEFNARLEPEGCFVLQDDSEFVGVATCICYGSVGWFGNLIVDQSHRKKGAGSFLVKAALEFLKHRGAASIGLYAYPHLLQFYGNLGFKPTIEFVVLKADSVKAPAKQDDGLKALVPGDLSAVASWDTICFGAPRDKLLRQILSGDQNRGYIAFKRTQMAGFVAAKRFGETAEIGPIVCGANQTETAQKLLRAILSDLEGFEAFMYLPAAEVDLVNAAFASGFREDFRLVRMFWGLVASKSCIYSAESLERG